MSCCIAFWGLCQQNRLKCVSNNMSTNEATHLWVTLEPLCHRFIAHLIPMSIALVAVTVQHRQKRPIAIHVRSNMHKHMKGCQRSSQQDANMAGFIAKSTHTRTVMFSWLRGGGRTSVSNTGRALERCSSGMFRGSSARPLRRSPPRRRAFLL